MKRKRTLSLLALALSVLMLLAACGGGGGETQQNAATEAPASEAPASEAPAADAAAPSEAPAAEETKAAEPAPAGSDNKDITVIVMALNSDYWHMVEAGAKIAGAEFGYNVSVIGPNAESDAVGQMNMIEDAAANKVAAIVLAPNEPNAVIPSVQKAKDAGVPVIIIDAKLATEDDSLQVSFIGTGNYDAAHQAGEYLAKKLQAGDKVAIIRGLVGQPTHDERTNGAKDALEAAGMVVVSVQPADSDRGKAVGVAENMFQSDPDIKAIYCTNDEMALGAYQAVEGLQLQSSVLTMGFDGSFGALDSIKEGKLTASMAQMPIEEGYLGVKAAVDFLEGRSVEKVIPNEVAIVDASNVDQFRADLDTKMAKAK